MKLLLSALLACLAVTQSVQAITSNLNSSLIELQAILNSPLIQTAIGQDEFIFEIERRTHNLIDTTVYYEIKTDIPGDSSGSSCEANVAGIEQESDEVLPLAMKHRHHHHNKHYKVRLEVTPNPAIGPPLVEVISIKRISEHHSHSIILDDETEE